MKKLTLDIQKIKKELKRLDRTKSWLARQMKCNPSLIQYIYKTKSIIYADRIAHVLGFDPKDLIK